jgi:hypothetical protein
MNTPAHSDSQIELFRHTLATLAYRAGKALRNAPDTFAANSTVVRDCARRDRFWRTWATCSIGRSRLREGQTGVA